MWYATSKTNKVEDAHEKKLREARQTVKWIPYIAAVVLVGSVVDCVILARHPTVEHLLHLIFPIGASLYCLSHWKKARATIAGTRDNLPSAFLLLDLMLMVSGPSLSDMWHHKQMILFYTFGIAILVIALFCLVLIVWERIGNLTSQKRLGRQK